MHTCTFLSKNLWRGHFVDIFGFSKDFVVQRYSRLKFDDWPQNLRKSALKHPIFNRAFPTEELNGFFWNFAVCFPTYQLNCWTKVQSLFQFLDNFMNFLQQNSWFLLEILATWKFQNSKAVVKKKFEAATTMSVRIWHISFQTSSFGRNFTSSIKRYDSLNKHILMQPSLGCRFPYCPFQWFSSAFEE